MHQPTGSASSDTSSVNYSARPLARPAPSNRPPGRAGPSTSPIIAQVLGRIRALAQRPARDAGRCVWIEGVREVLRASEAGYRFDTLVCSEILLKNVTAARLARRLAAAGVRRVRISPEEFRSVQRAPKASGIGAIVRQRWTPIQQADPAAGLCWLVFERINSPGNLGTTLRTAEACGAAGAIFLHPQCDPYDPVVVRASMGGLFGLTLIRTDLARFGQWAAARRAQLIAMTPRGQNVWALPVAGVGGAAGVALAVGEERGGLSDGLRRLCGVEVGLPMGGRADSLNVSVAASVMMYELMRRRWSTRGVRPT